MSRHHRAPVKRRLGAAAWLAIGLGLTPLAQMTLLEPARAETTATPSTLRLSETLPGSTLLEAAEQDPGLAGVLASLRAEAAAKGRTRVAVKTAVAFAPETLLNQAEALAQRREIAAAAAALRKEMPAAGRFEALTDAPYVLLDVDVTGLQRLGAVRGLVGISAGDALNWQRDFLQLRSSRFGDTPASQPAASARIIGGTKAASGVHPFQVALLSKAKSNRFNAQFCGGTLVAPSYVVTAAHCLDVWTNPVTQVDVLAGTQRLTTGGKRIAVKRAVIHPTWNTRTMDFDVAVLELATPVTGVAFATLPASQPTTAGTGLRTTGWGTRTSGVVNKPINLQVVDLPFVPTSNSSCLAVTPPSGFPPITARMICAGGVLNKSSCNGDSGGPLTIDRGAGYTELVGIVSWGSRNCGAVGFPGVYANVADSSINSFIRGLVPAVPDIAFVSATSTVSEGTGRVTLTVKRSSTDGTAQVRFSTADGTAVKKSDYTSQSDNVNFKRGQATATFKIFIRNDKVKELAETFTVTLSRPSTGWLLGSTKTATVTITDND